MSDDLKMSISGIRGIVGQSMNPESLLHWIQAWEQQSPDGPIVVARDARPHGATLLKLCCGLLEYAGREVLLADLIPTPTVGVLIRKYKAAGGVMLTASHNPIQWNALKFFNQDGLILTPEEFSGLEKEWQSPSHLSDVPYRAGGNTQLLADALSAHLDLITPEIDCDTILNRQLKVVVDGCRSVGGIAIPQALRSAGVTVIELDCQADGCFTRGLEPIPENIGALGEAVRANQADLGMAVDPDSDRLALVSETGQPIGEEMTLVLAADAILARKGGSLVANLSSTQLLDKVAEKHNVPIYRSKVGESHVVSLMREKQATIGGEGNGGVIFPPVQYGRDAVSGALLVVDLLARENVPLSEIVKRFPSTFMVKDKISGDAQTWQNIQACANDWWPDATLDQTDGLKWCWPDRWIHLRPSNTEPIIRILAEGPDQQQTELLIQQVRDKI